MNERRFQILSPAHLAALARGDTAELEVLGILRTGQLNKHKLLLQGVVRIGSKAAPDAAPVLRRNYELLADMERREPEKVADVIGAPQVGAWAARCLRGLSADSQAIRPELDHLTAIAAAAAVRTGYPCTLTLRAWNGMVMLPTLGRFLPHDGSDVSVAVSGLMQATIRAGASTIMMGSDGLEDAPGCERLRWVRLGGRSITLDDLDPYRDYGQCRLADRLSVADVDHWEHTLGEAWNLLCAHHPDYAATLQAGLNSLVPITLKADQKNLSATSGDAFGAVAASRPSDGAALALALIHEFQHAKLCAVIDLEPLCDQGDEQLFYAPWRPDPRPASALMQGIYAHMGVADFWRVHRRVAQGSAQLVAEVEFVRWLGQTIDAATRLEGHARLTEAGQYLLSQIVMRLAEWSGEPVSAQARDLAERTAADHLICWRLRNLIPSAAAVAEVAQAWQAGQSCPSHVQARICPSDGNSGRLIRSELLYRKLCDPAEFGARCAGGPPDPDIAYARGDYLEASAGYLGQIKANPAAHHAWGGLALTSEPDSALRQYPEVVAAVYCELGRTLTAFVDPFSLAEWLAPLSVDAGTPHV